MIDDLIAYYVSDDEIFLVPNAANTAAVVDALQAAAPQGISITNEHRSYAVLAVQGPRSADVLAALGLPTDMDYMGYADATYSGVPVRVCRTGYTGEHGYELLPPWDSARVVFDALVAEVQGAGGQLAGLGARDTLRTEMGYPLHGHELSLDISPLQARCGWAIGWKRMRSGAGMPCWLRRRPVRAGCCAACGRPGAAYCAGSDRAERHAAGRCHDVRHVLTDTESRDRPCSHRR